jgi:long-chain acyl-CoA synthetase
MSRTRYEWTLLDYAIWFVGAVTVPLYDTSSVDQIRWVLADSGARFALVESGAHAERIQDAASEEPPQVFRCIDDGCVESLMSGGVDIDDETLDDRRSTVSPRSLATIIYTSGTTGRPKGCMLTHGNFMFELGAAVEELDELFARDDASTVLFLPLAHVFARVIQVGAVRQRVRVAFSADIRSLMRDLQASRPTFLLAVPRVFEKIFNTASQNATADGRGKTFDKAAALAIAYSRAVERGRPGRLLKARHSVYDRTVYSRLRASLGGECAYVVSGGAPLGERLGHFYRGIGVTVLEGYGLTETTAAVTVNVPEAVKIGTVGRPLGGSAVRVAEDGELHVRGGQVMSGYWHDPDATEEVLDADGWLRTGDLAEIDDEGFVRITGRKKEILVTAGGKNVAPAALEDTIRAHALVDQCLVVGDRRPFIAALVTIDSDAFGLWAERSGKAGGLRRLTDDPDLRAEIQSAVDEANRTVSQAEAIRKFAILADEWTEEGGQLTPSLKLRRAVVMTQVGRQVEDLYLS